MMTEMYIYAQTLEEASELAAMAHAFQASATLLTASSQASSDLNECGADRIIELRGESPRPENYIEAIADEVANGKPLLFAASSSIAGREIAASVAGRLGLPMISDVSSIRIAEGRIEAERTVLGGAVINECAADAPCVITAVRGLYEPEAPKQAQSIEVRDVTSDNRIIRKSLEHFHNDEAGLDGADVVVCVGMGIDDEDLPMAEELASALGGAIGCTRDIAEGRKLMPKDRYIGITGAIVKPSLYLSMGVSGQLQHVYGIRDSKVIVAVNTNKDAPIFRVSDYGIVGDLHEVIPQIIAAL